MGEEGLEYQDIVPVGILKLFKWVDLREECSGISEMFPDWQYCSSALACCLAAE